MISGSYCGSAAGAALPPVSSWPVSQLRLGTAVIRADYHASSPVGQVLHSPWSLDWEIEVLRIRNYSERTAEPLVETPCATDAERRAK